MTKEGPARQLSSLGITQVELAERLGVTKAAVARASIEATPGILR